MHLAYNLHVMHVHRASLHGSVRQSCIIFELGIKKFWVHDTSKRLEKNEKAPSSKGAGAVACALL